MRKLARAVSPLTRQTPRYGALRTRVESREHAASLPALDTLRQRVAARPDDLQVRADLARRLIAEGRLEPALEQLLEIASRDQFLDKQARHDCLAGAGIVGEEKTKRLPWQHRLVNGGDLMRQRLHHRGVNGQNRIEEMSKSNPLRF